MELINYTLYQSCIDLYFTGNQTIRVHFNEWTGNIYKRRKNDPILKHFIDHKGIYIGAAGNGTHILVHNHNSPGRAIVVTWDIFAGNETVSIDNKYCTNAPMERISIALNKVLSREPYDAINNSCQTLVNEACTNQRMNDDTGRVVGGLLLTTALIAVLGNLFGE